MARNSKPMIKTRTINKRHEDKIANVLKSMKERKDRRRISLDDRLRRMELMVKKILKRCLIGQLEDVAKVLTVNEHNI